MVGTQLYIFTQISTYNYMFGPCILAIVRLCWRPFRGINILRTCSPQWDVRSEPGSYWRKADCTFGAFGPVLVAEIWRRLLTLHLILILSFSCHKVISLACCDSQSILKVRIFKISVPLVICLLQSVCLYLETEEKAENHEHTPTPRTGLYLVMPAF
jgi:hypothetical protein